MKKNSARMTGLFIALCFSLLLAQPSVGTTEIKTPKANETYKVGDTIHFKWEIHSPWMTTGTQIKLSYDEGRSLYSISTDMIKVDSLHYHDTVGTYDWVITDSLISTEYPTIATTGSAQVQVTHPYNSEILDGIAGPITISPTRVAMPMVKRGMVSHRQEIVRFLGDYSRLLPTTNTEVFDISGRGLPAKSSVGPHLPPGSVSGLFIVRNRK